MERAAIFPVENTASAKTVVRQEEVAHIEVEEQLIGSVLELLTPPAILERTEFEHPYVITPEVYPNFDTLVGYREAIRRLELLPVKTDEEYKRYHEQSKEDLIRTVIDYFEESELVIAPNLFPYYMPDDVGQYIIWIKDPELDRASIATFIARITKLLNLKPCDIILFERSLKTRSKLVRGTFPEYRHIHFWFKKSAKI